jgi:outer membrane protein OmpA-like peptidoglycan-associated protein
MKFYFLSAFIFSAGLLCSQSRSLKKAEKYYRAHCYALAIPHYKKALSKDSGNAEVAGRLGDCYRLTNNTDGEITAYGRLVNSGNATPLQQFYYAEALASGGRGNEASAYYQNYTADARGKQRQVTNEKVNAFNKNSDAYRVTRAKFNSASGDFGAISHSDDVYFLSSRKRSRWVNHRHGWTNHHPLHWYKASAKDTLVEHFEISRYKLNEGPMCFLGDSLVIFTRNEQPTGKDAKQQSSRLKLFSARHKNGTFTELQMLPFCGDTYNYAHPTASADGSTLYFASDKDGGFGSMDLYSVSRSESGSWTEPVNAGEKVNTAGKEVFPFVSANGKLYFSSDGHEGVGGLDIYEAKIRDGNVQRVYNMGVPVNSREDDFGIFLSNDNKTGFISSNRQHGGLDDDIYHLEILREVTRGKDLLIVTRDKSTGAPVAGVTLLFGNDSVVTDSKGEVQMMVDEDKRVTFTTRHPDFFTATDSVDAGRTAEDKITKEITVEKDPKLALVATVRDLKTGQPLEGVNVTVSELPSMAKLDKYVTDKPATWRKPLKGKRIGDKISYEFRLEKEGYVTKKAVFIHDVTGPGEITVNKYIDLSIGRIEVGMDVGKMIDLKPIYFDLGKSNIRKDAAVELDKMVEIMKEYPNMIIELGAHTDCRSAAASNMKLSSARAKSSAAYIIKKGIDKSRITGKGYGETKLLNACACEGKKKSECSEEDHALNRRTEFIITKLK